MTDVTTSLSLAVAQGGGPVPKEIPKASYAATGGYSSSSASSLSPIEDIIDLSGLQVETPVEDYLPQGKHLSSKKEFKDLKDYIAYLLLLLEKIDWLEPGGTVQTVKMEDQALYKELTSELGSLASAEFIR